MVGTCPDCGLTYDDLYRRRICPHEEFQMRVTCYRADGQTRVCTSVEELHAFMGGA